MPTFHSITYPGNPSKRPRLKRRMYVPSSKTGKILVHHACQSSPNKFWSLNFSKISTRTFFSYIPGRFIHMKNTEHSCPYRELNRERKIVGTKERERKREHFSSRPASSLMNPILEIKTSSRLGDGTERRCCRTIHALAVGER